MQLKESHWKLLYTESIHLTIQFQHNLLSLEGVLFLIYDSIWYEQSLNCFVRSVPYMVAQKHKGGDRSFTEQSHQVTGNNIHKEYISTSPEVLRGEAVWCWEFMSL